MNQRITPYKVKILVILTVTVLGSILAVTLFENKTDAAEPTEPSVESLPTSRPWEARQEAAVRRSAEVVPLVKEVLKETPAERRARLGDNVPQLEDIKFNYFLLNNPCLSG